MQPPLASRGARAASNPQAPSFARGGGRSAVLLISPPAVVRTKRLSVAAGGQMRAVDKGPRVWRGLMSEWRRARVELTYTDLQPVHVRFATAPWELILTKSLASVPTRDPTSKIWSGRRAFRPPIAVTSPRSVISPVIATSAPHRDAGQRRDEGRRHRDARARAVLGVAPSGTWMGCRASRTVVGLMPRRRRRGTHHERAASTDSFITSPSWPVR